jgi:competence protein ComGC
MKHEELVTANKLVVGLICEKLKRDGIIGEDAIVCKDHVKLCPMKIFSKLTNPQLEAFILAHDATITSKSQLPSKGTLKDAEDNTVRNRI